VNIVWLKTSFRNFFCKLSKYFLNNSTYTSLIKLFSAILQSLNFIKKLWAFFWINCAISFRWSSVCCQFFCAAKLFHMLAYWTTIWLFSRIPFFNFNAKQFSKIPHNSIWVSIKIAACNLFLFFFFFKGRKNDFGKVMGVFLRIIGPLAEAI
jgi:hypothetical protein